MNSGDDRVPTLCNVAQAFTVINVGSLQAGLQKNNKSVIDGDKKMATLTDLTVMW